MVVIEINERRFIGIKIHILHPFAKSAATPYFCFNVSSVFATSSSGIAMAMQMLTKNRVASVLLLANVKSSQLYIFPTALLPVLPSAIRLSRFDAEFHVLVAIRCAGRG
jgi:hypothetical protein